MEDVGNLRRRPAAAEKNPPNIHTAGMKLIAQTEEANQSPAPPAVAAQPHATADDVKESCTKSLEPGNQEEHEEVRACTWRQHSCLFESSVISIATPSVQVLEDKRPDDGGVSTGSKTGTAENRRCSKSSTDTGDVPASLICSSKGQQVEKTCDKKFWSTDQPSEAGTSVLDSLDGDLPAEVTKEDAGCDVDDQEAELRPAEASDAGSSLPWQPQKEDKTSQCVDEVSESSFNGLERPSPETGNPPEPHREISSETSHLPPTRELGSAPDEAASATVSDPGVAPGFPMGDLQLSSFEPMQKKDAENASSAGAGAESGISSLAVSPDAEADGNIFSSVQPVMEDDPQTNSLYADDALLSAANERMAEEMFASLQPCCSQMSHGTNWTAANEDAFGHEIEDSYHRLVEQFAAQIAVSVTSLTHQLTDVRAALEVVEAREKTSISIKEEEDLQTEADCERTEISIMEATMDTNEWITDATSPLPPWLLPSPVDHPKTSPLPSDQRSACDASAADVPAGLHQTGTLLADENMEHFKKVVAVQPMPQNVNVTFRVHYHTQSPYQTVAVTGDQPELGNWKEFLPLEKVKEGDWSAVVSLPTESHVEWKFVLLDKGEVCRWEECGNRLLHTGVGDDVVVHKWWGLV